jgi:hypothetical protein
MPNDRDVLVSAQALIRTHGRRAAAISSENAMRFQKNGDLEAAAIWSRIWQTVRKLEAESLKSK